MVWTSGSVRQLQSHALEAQGRIQKLFRDGLVEIDRDCYAWGQFLDEPRVNPQYGIYGTSAGVQVLGLSGYAPENTILSGAMRFLTEGFMESSSEFHARGDWTVLYKVAYLAEATQSDERWVDDDCAVMQAIVDMMLYGKGWGEYFGSVRERDQHPRLLATAAALCALSRYRPFYHGQACQSSLQWLCERILKNGNLRPHEYGVAALALIDYQENHHGVSSYEAARDACKRQLVNWVRDRAPREAGLAEVHLYPTFRDGSRKNRYLFLMPDCIASLVFLRLGCPRQTRSYVLKVIEYYVTAIARNGRFASDTTDRTTAVDQLWLFRLFSEFVSHPAERLAPRFFAGWLLLAPWLRIVVSVFFLVLGMVGLYIGFATESPGELAWRLVGGVVSVVGLNLFASALWDSMTR